MPIEERSEPVAPTPLESQVNSQVLKLSLSDRRILACKLQNPEFGPSDIARHIQLDRTYVWRRMNTRDLRRVLEAINELVLIEAKDTMIAAATEAVATTLEIMRGLRKEPIFNNMTDQVSFRTIADPESTPQVRLAAARTIMESLKDYQAEKGGDGEEAVYEMVVDAVGMIRQNKQKSLPGALDNDPVARVLDEYHEENE